MNLLIVEQHPYPINKAMEEYGNRSKKILYTYKAMNRLIQGSAADMTKTSYVRFIQRRNFSTHTST